MVCVLQHSRASPSVGCMWSSETRGPLSRPPRSFHGPTDSLTELLGCHMQGSGSQSSGPSPSLHFCTPACLSHPPPRKPSWGVRVMVFAFCLPCGLRVGRRQGRCAVPFGLYLKGFQKRWQRGNKKILSKQCFTHFFPCLERWEGLVVSIAHTCPLSPIPSPATFLVERRTLGHLVVCVHGIGQGFSRWPWWTGWMPKHQTARQRSFSSLF